MKNKNILQIHPNFGKEEIRAIVKYLKSGGWITEFKKTIELLSIMEQLAYLLLL